MKEYQNFDGVMDLNWTGASSKQKRKVGALYKLSLTKDNVTRLCILN